MYNGFGRSTAQKAVSSANKHYLDWSKEHNINSIKTLADYYNVKHNDSKRYALLQGYVKAVNKGDISPLTAAEIAKSFGIRVYTIGVGTNGMAPYPYPVGGTVQYVNMPVEIDEKTLTQIAGTTEGNYFRATSNSKLKEVYEEIDKLEKTKLNVKEYSKRQEEYRWFALAAFLCVLLEVLLRNSILKKIP